MLGKVLPIRDRDHLKFVASLPCIVTGGVQVQAHHLLRHGHRGIGMKSGDDWTIPLCFKVHDMLHRSGDETGFFFKLGIDAGNAAQMLYRYTRDYWEAERFIQEVFAPNWSANCKKLGEK